MTTLYRPVLIESAEQAEALPIGTVALVAKPIKTMPVGELYRAHKGMRDLPAVKVMADRWYVPGALTRRRDAEVVDGHALVPIEAEEETTERPRLCQAVPDVLHRYTTPWTLDTPQEDPQ